MPGKDDPLESFVGAMDQMRTMRDAKTSQELLDAFDVSTREIGFLGLAVGHNFRQTEDGITTNDTFITMPDAWVEYYFENEFMKIDPLILWCMTQQTPRVWRNIREWAGDDNPVFREAERHGLIDGVALPVHLSEKVAIISGAVPKTLDSTTYMLFCIIARFVGTKLHLLNNDCHVPMHVNDHPYDEKDLTIMTLIHAGKENKQIEEATGLTRQSIHSRLRRLQKDTSTDTRTGPSMVYHWLGII